MASFNFKADQEDEKPVTLSSFGAVPQVEVVEMGETTSSVSCSRGPASGFDSQAKQATAFSSQKMHLRTSYNKHQREKIVSKYQSKKKIKPSSVIETAVKIEDQIKMKTESSEGQRLQQTLDSQASCSEESSMQKKETCYPEDSSTEKKELNTVQNVGASDPCSADNDLVTAGRITFSDTGLWSANLSTSSTYEDGQDLSDQFSSSAASQEEDLRIIDRAPEPGMCSESCAENEGFSESEGGGLEDWNSSEDECDVELKKKVLSSLSCHVHVAKLSSSVVDGEHEWRKTGTVWRVSSAPESPVSRSPSNCGSTDHLTLDSSKSETSESPALGSFTSASMNQSEEKSGKSPVLATQKMLKSSAKSPNSNFSPKFKTLKISVKDASVSDSSLPMVSDSRVCVDVTHQDLPVSLSRQSYTTLSSPSVENPTKQKRPVNASASSKPSLGSVTILSPEKGKRNVISSPIKFHNPSSEFEGLYSKKSGSTEARLYKGQMSAVSCSDKAFFSLNVGKSAHVSELMNQSEYTSLEKEILPQIQSTGHLGLSSHSETDWTMDEVEEPNSPDENDEDMDVLSLYEYDTFLESEEDADDRSHSSAQTKRSVNRTAVQPKRGEGTLILSSEENLSISISNQSERRVSRPVPRIQLDTGNRVVVQNDGQEKDKKKTDEEEKVNMGKDFSEENSTEKHPREAEVKTINTGQSDAKVSPNVTKGHTFQVPKVPLLRNNPKTKNTSKMNQRQVEHSIRGKFSQQIKPRTGMGCLSLPQDQNRSVDSGPKSREQLVVPTPQRIQCSVEETKKELEMELKLSIEKRNISGATETVGRIHRHELRIDRGLVLNLLHLFIREGAVPQLMKIFTFVCNQGLLNAEVSNAFIRLGCGQTKRYDRQLKNIFQYIRRHSIQLAGDCMISLLRVYSEHKGDPVMFWFMLSYFENVPSFTVPMPMLERAIFKVLQHKDQKALSKLNQWVLTTKSEGALKKLDLSIVGKMAPSMLPASLSRLQKLIADSQEGEGEKVEEPLPTAEDIILVPPQDFSDQDFQYYGRCIQDCGTNRDFSRLAQVFAELCRRHGHARPLLKEFAQTLVKQDVVVSTDTFLHHLYEACGQDSTEKTLVETDKLALAHLASIVLEHVCFKHKIETTVALLEAITACPLVVKKLLMNCREIGKRMMTAYLQRQRPSQALEVLKVTRFGQKDEQGTMLVKDLLRQLVAAHDVPSAFTALSTAASQKVIGIADVGSLSSLLMWHALNAGNIEIALDLLDLRQKQPLPVPTLPSPLLRGVLVACFHACHFQRADSLFQSLKQRKVYNAEAFRGHPYVFQLSTMLTPTEIRLCVLDRLKELYQRVCSIIATGGALSSMDKYMAIQILPEHNPQLLALPFLALAPRSLEQAVDVMTYELTKISPPLEATFDPQLKLLVVDSLSLINYLKNYDSTCTKQGLAGQNDTQRGSLPPGPVSSAPQGQQPLLGMERQLSVPAVPVPDTAQQPLRTMKRCLSDPSERQQTNQQQVVPGPHNRPVLPPPCLDLAERGPLLPTPPTEPLFKKPVPKPTTDCPLPTPSHTASVESGGAPPKHTFGEPVPKIPKSSPPGKRFERGPKQVHDKNRPYQHRADQQSLKRSSEGYYQQPSSSKHAAKQPRLSRSGLEQSTRGSRQAQQHKGGHKWFGKQVSRGSGKTPPSRTGTETRQLSSQPGRGSSRFPSRTNRGIEQFSRRGAGHPNNPSSTERLRLPFMQSEERFTESIKSQKEIREPSRLTKQFPNSRDQEFSRGSSMQQDGRPLSSTSGEDRKPFREADTVRRPGGQGREDADWKTGQHGRLFEQNLFQEPAQSQLKEPLRSDQSRDPPFSQFKRLPQDQPQRRPQQNQFRNQKGRLRELEQDHLRYPHNEYRDSLLEQAREPSLNRFFEPDAQSQIKPVIGGASRVVPEQFGQTQTRTQMGKTSRVPQDYQTRQSAGLWKQEEFAQQTYFQFGSDSSKTPQHLGRQQIPVGTSALPQNSQHLGRRQIPVGTSALPQNSQHLGRRQIPVGTSALPQKSQHLGRQHFPVGTSALPQKSQHLGGRQIPVGTSALPQKSQHLGRQQFPVGTSALPQKSQHLGRRQIPVGTSALPQKSQHLGRQQFPVGTSALPQKSQHLGGRQIPVGTSTLPQKSQQFPAHFQSRQDLQTQDRELTRWKLQSDCYWNDQRKRQEPF